MKLKITRDNLQQGLAAVGASIPTRTTLPVLSNILIEVGTDSVAMSGTDLDIAVSVTVPADVEEQGALTVPAKKLQELARELPEYPVRLNAKGDRLELACGRATFRLNGMPVYTRLIEGPYPNYEQVIPRDNDKIAIADRNQLIQALRRMAVVASDQTHRVRLAFTSNMVRFSVETPDLGEAHEELEIDYQGDPLDIGFNASYLLEVLRYMPTDEVKLTFKAPERASTIEPTGDTAPDYL